MRREHTGYTKKRRKIVVAKRLLRERQEITSKPGQSPGIKIATDEEGKSKEPKESRREAWTALFKTKWHDQKGTAITHGGKNEPEQAQGAKAGTSFGMPIRTGNM